MSDVGQLIETALDTKASSFRRRMAVPELAKSGGDRCVETLVSLLNDDDQYMRREAVKALKHVGNSDAVAPLIDALRDTDDYVQRDAASALAKLGDGRALEPLRSLCQTGSYSVRDAAERALEEVQERCASQPVSESVPAASSRPPSPVPSAPPIAEAAPSGPPMPSAIDIPAPADVPVPAGPPTSQHTTADTPGVTIASALEPDDAAIDVGLIFSDSSGEDDASPRLGESSQDETIASGIVFVESAEVDSEPRSEQNAAADPSWRDPTVPTVAGLQDAGETFGQVSGSVGKPATALASDKSVVVAAVIVDEALPAIGDELETEIHFATIIPRVFTWNRAKRFQGFFGNEISNIQTAYQQLVQRQQDLLDLEQQQHETLMQLGLHRADKEDDIARCEEDIDAVKETVLRLERSAARAQRELRSLEKQSAAFWHQVGILVSPDKGERARQMQSDLEVSIRELGSKISDARRELDTHQRQHEELVAPVERLRAATDELTSQRDAALQAIARANEDVDQLVVKTVRRLSPEELNNRLRQLIDLDDRNECMVTCVQQLMAMLAELEQRSAESRQVETVVNEADAASQESTGQLAASIADGFAVSSAELQTPFRLSGSIRFQEEHSFFGGYSGASGSISGSGAGQAVYEVQQLRWNLPQDLDGQIAAFTVAWERCGGRHAEHEVIRRRLSACEQSISEYIGLIRSELERDFMEQRR